ncbi:hypothetical protein ACOME3_000259 [Neoechinorhynchus agilis]
MWTSHSKDESRLCLISWKILVNLSGTKMLYLQGVYEKGFELPKSNDEIKLIGDSYQHEIAEQMVQLYSNLTHEVVRQSHKLGTAYLPHAALVRHLMNPKCFGLTMEKFTFLMQQKYGFLDSLLEICADIADSIDFIKTFRKNTLCWRVLPGGRTVSCTGINSFNVDYPADDEVDDWNSESLETSNLEDTKEEILEE